MGAVYEVEHVKLGVRYALKAFSLDPNHHQVQLLKRKFFSEGKVLARLHDPHIVHVFDLDIDDASGTPYFVMDLVLYKNGEPETLADVETEGLEESFLFDWFSDLAQALDYVHAQGIVHRDIKLGNILLNANRHVVLSDFGISRIFGQGLRTDIGVSQSTMTTDTVSGKRLVMGTAGYMAPEIRRGEPATPTADAYSLGVVFFRLLTGVWYESGANVKQLLEPFELRWVDILPRLLAENPADRPTELQPLLDGLQPHTSEVAVAPSPSQKHPSSGSRPALFVLVGALLGAALLALALLAGRWQNPRAVTEPAPNKDAYSDVFAIPEEVK